MLKVFLCSALALVSPAVMAAQFLKVVPGSVTNYDRFPEEKARLIQAFSLMEIVINSEEFKERVIHFPGGFTNNQKLSNEEIYEKLMRGEELLDGEHTLAEMNFDVSRYAKFSKVIGRSYPGISNTIEVNGNHYALFASHEMAGNLTHEWIHLMGFRHTNSSDLHSVPYAVGYIMRDLAAKLLTVGFLQ
jgi:hypothetical protein